MESAVLYGLLGWVGYASARGNGKEVCTGELPTSMAHWIFETMSHKFNTNLGYLRYQQSAIVSNRQAQMWLMQAYCFLSIRNLASITWVTPNNAT